ncbi:MAG: YncE family protein [Bacteroidota bacterium]
MKNLLMWLILLAGCMANLSCNKDCCRRNEEEKIYVANEDDGTISVIHPETYEIIRTVDLTYKKDMYMAHNVQAAPDGRSVWATCIPMHHGHEDDMVVVLKGKRDKDKEHIKVGVDHHIAHVVLDDESKFAYVTANSTGQVIKIDARHMKVMLRYDLGGSSAPHGMRYMNGKLYVACMGSKEMAIVDVSNGTIAHVPLGGIAVQTAVVPALGCVYITVYDLKQVVRYDITTGDTTIIPLPAGAQGPIQLYPSSDNRKLYVCDQGIVNGNPSSNKLYVIDIPTSTVTSTVTVGNGAHGVTTSIDGSKIFVTNITDNTVSVVDAVSLNVIKTITVGAGPNGISTLRCD